MFSHYSCHLLCTKTRALPTTTAVSAMGVWAITALWSVANSLLHLGQAQPTPLWREQRMQRALWCTGGAVQVAQG